MFTTHRARTEKIITGVVLVIAVGFIFSQLHPGLIFANTTPNGGDMGAHVWTPAYLRDHLLPHGRLTGWAPDWYGGFPALTFYFPLPSLLIVLGDLVMPYNVAFKLVAVSGLLTLPLATWYFAKSMKLSFPGPAIMAMATVPFVFDRTFTIYGGNIASTLAGEFANSISLSFCLFFLGVFARVLDTGKHKALAAALLAATGLCHIIPAILAIVGALVLLAMQGDYKKTLKRAMPVFIVGALLAAFWIIPFLARIGYTNDMGWEKLVKYRNELFPTKGTLLTVWAAVGVILAVGRRSRIGLWAAAIASISAAMFILMPQGRLWNARLLPLWFLCLYLLAGVAVSELALGGSWLLNALKRTVLGEGAKDDSLDAIENIPRLVAPLLAVAYILIVVGMPLGMLPNWYPRHTTDTSFIGGWANWNFSGYERKPSYPEYRDTIETMKSVGEKYGCGRAMWEYEPELDRLGTPMALMLLPYWTNGCIDSMEGLFFESAASTPYHFINQSELSARPSRPQRDLPYTDLNVAEGVRHLQAIGVKYYMAISTAAVEQASLVDDLELVSETKPWSATVTENGASAVQTRAWKIYRVKDSALVEPLKNLPAVMTKVPKGGREWQNAAVAAYTAEGDRDVLFAASGPKSWPRVDRPSSNPPTKAVGKTAKVSNIVATDDRITFDVDRVGVPVVVKASYFPNWKAKGADGIWRSTPNEMIVVPTSKHVSLHYGNTPIDTGANLLTFAGLAGLGWLWWKGRNPDEDPDDSPDEAEAMQPPPAADEVADLGEVSDDEADWLKELAGVGGPGT